MTHGVNPAVKEVQTPDLQAVGDRGRIKSHRQELPTRDDTLLPSRQPGEQNVGSGQLTPIIALN